MKLHISHNCSYSPTDMSVGRQRLKVIFCQYEYIDDVWCMKKRSVGLFMLNSQCRLLF